MSHLSHSHSLPAGDDSIARRLRHERGLTQVDVAARVGVSRRTIGRIERREVRPMPTTAVLLAAALGCRPADLRGDDR